MLLCLFLCAIITVNAQDRFAEAKALMHQKKYSEANLAYEYIAYKSADPEQVVLAKLGRAQALKKMKTYDRGLEILGSINLLTAPDDQRPALIYEIVLLNFLNREYHESLTRGQMGVSFVLSTEYEEPIYMLLALSALEVNDWEKVKSFGNNYLNHLTNHTSYDNLQTQFDSLMNRELPELKNPEKARKWSTIIPGSGQIYAGAIMDGIYNFSLHAIVLGLSGWTFLSGYYVTGWLSGATILQKLHSGGQIRAVEICENKNRLKIHKYSQPIKEFLVFLREQNK